MGENKKDSCIILIDVLYYRQRESHTSGSIPSVFDYLCFNIGKPSLVAIVAAISFSL
jgi:hypothetical protein